MKIRMTQQELDSVAEFLNRKYEERRAKAKKAGKHYSMTRFAKDVGIKQPTMSKLMKLGPDLSPMEGIDTPILMALWDAFKDEFMEAMRGDAKATKEKQDARQATKEAKKKGAGG